MVETRIEGYELGARLYEHRMGAVYHAGVPDSRQSVELLRFDTVLTSLPKFRPRFLRAAKAAMSEGDAIDGVIKILDAHCKDSQCFIVREWRDMERLEGIFSLRAESKPLMSPPELFQFSSKLARCLAGIHRKAIVHGNVTPQAMRVDKEGDLWLSDLGLPLLNAGDLKPLQEKALEVVPFLAPEQMAGHAPAPTVDVFSWGVVIYYLATGRFPRAPSLLSNGLRAYWSTSPIPVHDLGGSVDHSLSDIIHRSLEVRPRQRYKDAGQLLAALQTLANGRNRNVQTKPFTAPDSDVSPPVEDEATLAVSLQPARVTVDPGSSGLLALTIRNQSKTAQNFTVRIEGVPRQWIRIPQEFVRLAPGATARVGLSINVPRESSAQSGDYPMRVEVSSTGQHPQSSLRECMLTVAAYEELHVELKPLEIQNGQAVVATIRNTGNRPTTVVLRGEGENELLRFTSERSQIRLNPGQVVVSTIKVSARDQPLFGRTLRHSFRIHIDAQELPAETHNGVVVVAPVIPQWLAGIILAVLLASCAAITYLFASQFDAPTPVAQPTPVIVATTVPPTQRATAMPTATLPVGVDDEPIANEIAVQIQRDGRDEIWIVARDSGDARLLIAGGSQPAWSPDGRRLAFTRPVGGALSGAQLLYVVTARGTQLSPVIEQPMQIGGISWSPDGRLIAFHGRPFTSVNFSDYQIFVANSDGAGVRQLTTESDVGDGHMWPLWSPQGNYLLARQVPQDIAQSARLLRLSVATGNATELVEDGQYTVLAGEYDWSPHGDRIVFSATRNGGSPQVFILTAGGGDPQQLTSFEAGARMPLWSPDGEHLLFSKDASEASTELVVSRIDGSAQETLATTESLIAYFWSTTDDEIGVLGDVEGDGDDELWIIPTEGSEPPILISDNTAFSEGESAPVEFVSASWRPQEP